MPQLRTYNVMISHAWKYGEHYAGLVKLLDAARYFEWRDFSVPEDHPIHSRSAARIREALQEQVRHTHVVLMLAGVYASHSDWMQEEVEMAKNYSKPIIGIRPRGNERISSVVANAADVMVNWNTASIVDAIREYAR
jgi:hypothetical protein